MLNMKDLLALRRDDLMGLDLTEPVPEVEPLLARATLQLILYFECQLLLLCWQQERFGFNQVEAKTRAMNKLNIELKVLPQAEREHVLTAMELVWD